MKALKLALNKASLLMGVLLILCGRADAIFLRMDGKPNLSLSFENNQAKISGTYEIENNGDEMAQNVFPSFAIGSWLWVGEPKVLNAGQKAQWVLDETFPVEKLSCANDSFCAEANLPLIGSFPVRIQRHYEDANGYPFSAPGIIHLISKGLSQQQRTATQIKSLRAFTELSGDGEAFDGKLVVNSTSMDTKLISVAYYSSRELRCLTKTSQISVGPHASEVFKYQVENFSGGDGSNYPVFVILQWEDEGVRNSLSVANIAQIREPDKSNNYFYWGAAFISLFLIAMYLSVFRRQKSG